MAKLTISSIVDLYSARRDRILYQEVIIKTDKLKDLGLLRHAVKFGFFRTKNGGLLRISCPPTKGYGFSVRNVKFWQVQNEIRKTLRDDVYTECISEKEGLITLRKNRHFLRPQGISFGIIFSGNQNEEPLLLKALNSIDGLDKPSRLKVEVIIIGCSTYDSDLLISRFPNLLIRYETLDDVDDHGRFLVCKKKELAYQLAQHDIVAISHTRIIFPPDLLRWIVLYDFEVIAPKVFYLHEGLKLPYLDYLLTGSYDTARSNTSNTLGSSDFGADYLYHLGKRVPYIDGGITFFDKRKIPVSPYNSYLAWGEGEDFEMCARLYYEGFLIDYFFEIECQSLTSKLVMNASAFRYPGIMAKNVFTFFEKLRIKLRFFDN